MKLTKPIYFATILSLLSGCGSAILIPMSECQPLSTYDSIIISPIAIDETIVEEKKYDSLPLKISTLSANYLKENLSGTRMFKNVSQSSNCATGAIKVDSRIISLLHDDGEFHAEIRGSIVDCKTGNTLYRFSEEWSDGSTTSIAESFANDISEEIKGHLICKKGKE